MKTEIIKIVEAELKSNSHPKESNDEFVNRVCSIYLSKVYGQKGYTTRELFLEVWEEVVLEATEVFKVKIYGHYNLESYRQTLMDRKVG